METVEKDNSVQSQVSKTFDTTFTKGKVLTKVICKKDSTQSYALYLPSNYTSDKVFPIIYFFDSHGSGWLPVEKYKALAEKYGYIIAGSNNSKNGLSWEIVHASVNSFFDDTYQRLSLDVRRTYTAGFSGGARVASSLAISDGGICGVIGCSAGFPKIEQAIQNKFNYIGFVGNEDFNYNEMKNLDRALDKSEIKHQLIVYDGKHEWPTKELLEEGFLWFEVNAMKDRLVTVNDSLIKSLNGKFENNLKELKSKKKEFDVYLSEKKLINYLDGLTDISAYKQEFTQLENSAEIQKELKTKEDVEKAEIQKQQMYSNSFPTQELSWWVNEVNKLKQQTTNLENAVVNKRLLNFLSMASYMNCNAALNSDQPEMIEKFLKIYAMVDPKNPDQKYFFACFYAKQGKTDKAISSLKEAIQLGFDDMGKIENEPAFAAIRNTKEFIKTVKP